MRPDPSGMERLEKCPAVQPVRRGKYHGRPVPVRREDGLLRAAAGYPLLRPFSSRRLSSPWRRCPASLTSGRILPPSASRSSPGRASPHPHRQVYALVRTDGQGHPGIQNTLLTRWNAGRRLWTCRRPSLSAMTSPTEVATLTGFTGLSRDELADFIAN